MNGDELRALARRHLGPHFTREQAWDSDLPVFVRGEGSYLGSAWTWATVAPTSWRPNSLGYLGDCGPATELPCVQAVESCDGLRPLFE